MKMLFEKIFRLPLEGKLSPKVTDEVENRVDNKHLIRQASLTPSPRGEGSRRGFTLVEVVVALAVIVIVTGISIGVVRVDNKTHFETVDMIEATNIAENAVECFRFAVKNNSTDVQKRNEFNLLLARSMNPEFAPIHDDVGGGIINIPFELEDNNHYIITEDRVTVYIAVDFVNDEITISAKNAGGTNEYLIEEVTYTVR